MSAGIGSSSAPVLCVSGPTAVGKSEVALLLAERLGGEILSADSMQVYRGLDIGTAKPGRGERARVPHHGIDVAEITDRFDVAKFVELGRAALADIEARGRLPILCGGTGLYLAALFGGLGTAPAGDPEMRAELEKTPLIELLDELKRGDPATHETIDRRNPRRVMRAVEVLRLSGRSHSVQRADWRTTGVSGDVRQRPLVLALNRPRDSLRARIDARIDGMFAEGLVQETASLLPLGLAGNPTALQAIGYRQVAQHLRGDRSLAETIALVKQKTWQLARRQITYLRHQLLVSWMDWADTESASEIASRIERGYRGSAAARNQSVSFPPPQH